MKTIKGDLIKLAEEGEFNIIIHGSNCFHCMGSGIAGQLATKYPQVLEADKTQTDYGDKEKLGKWSVATVGNFTVINAYTQYFFGLGSDVFEYDAFDRFLKNFVNMIEYYMSYDNLIFYNSKWDSDEIRMVEKFRIGFPQIGAGLAGGDWNRIFKMIEQFAKDVEDYADVTIVEYQP